MRKRFRGLNLKNVFGMGFRAKNGSVLGAKSQDRFSSKRLSFLSTNGIMQIREKQNRKFMGRKVAANDKVSLKRKK